MIVTVLLEQLDALREAARKQRLRIGKGVAFRRDEEEVAHVFYTRPSYQPGGTPAPCYFVLPELGREPSPKTADALRSAGAGEDDIIIFVPWQNVDEPRAYLGTGAKKSCQLQVASPHEDAAARSKGLLELDQLEQRHVTIVGLGSFGSTVAVELAKAGVGEFDLLDFDRLEPGNIARHHCGVADLGRFKTHAVADAIAQKNPSVVVRTHEVDVNSHIDLLNGLVRDSDVLICVTDEPRSRFNCNAAAVAAGRSALFGRAITRAAGGDVFVYRPATDGPCLACLFNQGLSMGADEVSNQRQASRNTPDYAPPGTEASQIQPGLANDIAPLIQMIVKLALVELAPRQQPWLKLRQDLEAPFYIWANRRELIYEGWEPMKFFYNRNAILRWYGVRVERDPACLSCALTG